MPARVVQSLHVDDHDVPYVELCGDAAGPSVLVVAGIHGCEYASIEAVRRLTRELATEDVAGTVTLVPVVNVSGFEQRAAFVVPEDGKNLNRCFPGNPKGSAAERLAAAVFDRLIRGHDYLLDLHAGDLPESLEPFVLYEASTVEESARAIAHAYGTRYVVRLADDGNSPIAGSTSSAAAAVGIPAIIAEAGGQGLLQTSAVDLHRAGVRRVLQTLGIVPGAAQSTAAEELSGSAWQYAPVSGWWSADVAVGARVRRGQRLGTLSDLLGEPLAEVECETDGVLLFLTSSPAVTGGGVLLGIGIDAVGATV